MIIEEPEVWGVAGPHPDWITVRVTLKTAPMEQWAVAREMRAADQGPLRPRGHRVRPPDRPDVGPARLTPHPVAHGQRWRPA